VDPRLANRAARSGGMLHGLVYFAQEATDRYAALGVTGRSGYFASRAAPMGAVTADVVVATFYNFSPDLVRRSMAGVWDITTPEAMLDARRRGVDEALRTVLGPERVASAEIAEAAELARTAALAACEHTIGRPLFAGHAGLDWPDDPLLVLWHGQTLLREFRGDGHIIALAAEGVNGREALVLHAAMGEVPRATLQSSREVSDEDWAATVASLHARGHLEADGSFTASGRAFRQAIEDRTDTLSMAAFEPLGDEGCQRYAAICGPLAQAIATSPELADRIAAVLKPSP
jgi:hypothetical protein